MADDSCCDSLALLLGDNRIPLESSGIGVKLELPDDLGVLYFKFCPFCGSRLIPVPSPNQSLCSDNYRLEHTNVIRHIQQEISKTKRSGIRFTSESECIQALKAAAVIVSHADNTITLHRTWELEIPTLKSILSWLCSIPPCRVRGEQSLLSRKIWGDWVCDYTSTLPRRVADLSAILSSIFGIEITVTEREVLSHVYIADFSCLSNSLNQIEIDTASVIDHLTIPSDQTGRYHFSSIDNFVEMLSRRIGVPIVSESISIEHINIVWNSLSDASNDGLNPQDLIQLIESQTGIRFFSANKMIKVVSIEVP